MKKKISEYVKLVQKMLLDNNYLKTEDIVSSIKISKESVYKIIREMRIQGTGVISTYKGYVLSKYAKKNDDVHFFRRLNGRRTSDMIAINAAKEDILLRWSSVEDKRNYSIIMNSLKSDVNSLNQGFRVLLSYKNSFDI